METIKKNSKSIAVAAGITAATIGVYLLFRRFKKTKNIYDRSLKKVFTKAEKDRILSQIKIIYDGQYLSVDTVVAINKAILDFSEPEHTNLMATNLKLRRAHKNNFAHYVKLCEELLDNASDLKKNTTRLVLDRFGISESEWQNSAIYHSGRGEPKWLAFKASLTKAKEEERRKTIRTLTFDEFKAAMIRNTELLETEVINGPNVQRMLKNPQNAGIILYYKVNDIVFEELGVEDLEFALAIPTYRSGLNKEDIDRLNRYFRAAENIGK